MTDPPWTFDLPTKIRFGCGVFKELPEIARGYGARSAIVTGMRLANDPALIRLRDALGARVVFSEVTPNPTVEQVDALAGAILAERCDVVIAIGGGSPIDCAKAASALAATGEGSIRDFHSGGKILGAGRIPLIAVPTTAGTGSEVTSIAVLGDTIRNIKAPLASPALYPEHAVVDPKLTLSMSRFITTATALDAFTHAIEGFWSLGHQPICDLAALEAARLIMENLAGVIENPCDLERRTRLSYAALLAGMAFQLQKNAMVHACAFPLSNRIYLSHGAACAFTLEFAIRFNSESAPDRLAQFANYCGYVSTGVMADAVHKLKILGGLPCTLREAGISNDIVPALIAESFHPLMKNNPRKVTPEDLQRMYMELDNV
jgi:alcohol dehydrogenase